MAFRKPRSLSEIEAQSRRNAEAIVARTSKLRPWKNCKTGFYKSKVTGRWQPYRSGLELSFYKMLDKPEKIVEFDAEGAIIPYLFKGAKLNYVPDVLIKGKSGRIYVVEVKPSDQLQEDKNKAKWQAARDWVWARGAKFLVVTEKNMQAITNVIA